MIIGIGDNCIDYYLSPINKRFSGGNVVNVVANLQKHGQPAIYVGTVGTDKSGESLISDLKRLGINTQFITRENGTTGVTEIEVIDGEYIIKSENYGVSSKVHLTEETMKYLTGHASLIHMSLTGGALELIKDLKNLNVPLSCDISTFYEQHSVDYWKQIFPYLDYIFVSGGSVTSDNQIRRMIEEIASYGPKHIVVTRGSKGAIAYWEGKEFSQLPLIYETEVVDPLGAGDAFISGFLYSMLHEENHVEGHLHQGSQWAAEACSHYGAW